MGKILQVLTAVCGCETNPNHLLRRDTLTPHSHTPTLQTYVGSGSGSWDISSIEPVINFMDQDAPQKGERSVNVATSILIYRLLSAASFESFRAVVVAFAVSRGILAFQYAIRK